MKGVVDIATPSFKAWAMWRGRHVAVKFSGVADMSTKALLDQFLSSLHEELRKMPSVDVSLDILDLEFMNSSCIKALISWISRNVNQSKERQYLITIHTDSSRLWQRRSVQALCMMAPSVVRSTADERTGGLTKR
jgi:hypothetical protein